MNCIYYAHSAEGRPEEYWQTLVSHLTQVGEMAAEFAAMSFSVQTAMISYTVVGKLSSSNEEFTTSLS